MYYNIHVAGHCLFICNVTPGYIYVPLSLYRNVRTSTACTRSYVRIVHILHTHAATRPVSCVHYMTYVSTLVYTSLAMTDCIMFRVQFMHDTTYSGQKQEQPTCSEHEHVGTRQEVMCI